MKPRDIIRGVYAPSPRMSKSAALIIALAIALPAGGIIQLLSALW